MQVKDIDYKFWLEELFYFVGQIFYTLGEYLAAFSYLVLLIVNMFNGNLHNASADDERQRLYEEQKRQRFWEAGEREQREFEERQRLYTLRFGNWQERHLAAVTDDDCEEANRIGQLNFDSHRRRNEIAQLHSEADANG